MKITGTDGPMVAAGGSHTAPGARLGRCRGYYHYPREAAGVLVGGTGGSCETAGKGPHRELPRAAACAALGRQRPPGKPSTTRQVSTAWP